MTTNMVWAGVAIVTAVVTNVIMFLAMRSCKFTIEHLTMLEKELEFLRERQSSLRSIQIRQLEREREELWNAWTKAKKGTTWAVKVGQKAKAFEAQNPEIVERYGSIFGYSAYPYRPLHTWLTGYAGAVEQAKAEAVAPPKVEKDAL